MGARSSKFVKRYEYHTNLSQVQQMVEEMKQAQKTNNEELSKTLRKLQTDINTLQASQQKHVRWHFRT